MKTSQRQPLIDGMSSDLLGSAVKKVSTMTAIPIFRICVEAIRANKLIQRVSATDKEFHFQNWFQNRLDEFGANFEAGGRNSYPDFRMVATTDGYEIKGLAYPGRDATFDSNSQVPTGLHNGRSIYYVFGRYPKKPDGNSYPVLDLVVCHGDFLNADHDYVHKNKSVKGLPTPGSLLCRRRLREARTQPTATVVSPSNGNGATRNE